VKSAATGIAQVPGAQPLKFNPSASTQSQPLAQPQVLMSTSPALGLTVAAVIVAVIDETPMVLVVDDGDGRPLRLPTAQFKPHDTTGAEYGSCLEGRLRKGVADLTGANLGYVEQLCTLTRAPRISDTSLDVCVGHLALTRGNIALRPGARFVSWYEFLPWEDWRHGSPRAVTEAITPKLAAWADTQPGDADTAAPLSAAERVRVMFGCGSPWDEERAADRFDVLAEAGFLTETASADPPLDPHVFGRPMPPEHRRLLAIAVGRLRAKIKYRPVVFELMADDFTLFELQRTVEAILGPNLHKQNFRRLVESAGLVEPTGDIKMHTGGRPAKLFRFRRDVLRERAQAGVRVKTGRPGLADL
jgi:hypothetical protein